MEKHATRQRLLTQRKQLESAVCRQLSLRAQQQLIKSDCFQQATSVALYSSINNEVHTDLLFDEAKSQGKRVCYPKVRGEKLGFIQIEKLADLERGLFGVAEPFVGIDCRIDALDLIVVPGVAFDRRGYRLGYGKGFYDRELSRVSAATISVGLCYDFQLCELLPVEDHDRPVQGIATESQFNPCDSVVAGSP